MTTGRSSDPTHLAWIDYARSQSDLAEQTAANAPPPIRAVAVLNADSCPGYELEREIHRGAQGVVYRAIQTSTGLRVAIKMLHTHTLGGPLEKARFEREMRILAALRHPNIVTIHDGGSHDGRFFLVMDYIAGQPLDRYMAGRILSIRESLELFVTICDAVNSAHLRGVIHRDVKPANVRIDESGRAFVLDFGLAKLIADAPESLGFEEGTARTLTGQFLGSLPWAAPEQFRAGSDNVDTRTDVYSLGVVLFQMLTGKFPYPATGPVKEAMEAILHAAPLSPRRLRREVDDELETIVLKCLHKESERRYQTAGELARDVQRYLDGEAIEAKRDSTLYVLRKNIRRYRMPIVILLAFVMLLAVSTVVSSRLYFQARESAAVARQNLRQSLIAHARAARQTGRVGQRFDALDALSRASQIKPSIEARNEAIAAMTLPDLRVTRRIGPVGTGYFDSPLARCAVMVADGSIVVVRTSDDEKLADIPAPESGLKQMHGGQLSGQFFVRIFDPSEGPRRLEVWNVTRGSLHWEITDIPDRARFDISPDGQRLAVGRLDQAIHIYDLESGKEIQRIQLDRDPSYLTFEPSGQKLALYHANFVGAQILDLSTGEREPVFESQLISWSVAWHPDGDLLAGASGAQVELWDTKMRRRKAVLQGHEEQVVHVRFSHKGDLLLTYSWDGQMVLWDTRTGRLLLRDMLAHPVFSQDDQHVAGTASGNLAEGATIFELNHALERRCMVGLGNPQSPTATRGAFDSQSGVLLTAGVSADSVDSGLRVFDVENNCELSRLAGPSILPLAVDPLSRFFLAGHDDGIYRWPMRREGQKIVIGPPDQLTSSNRPNAIDLCALGETAVSVQYGQDGLTVFDFQPPITPRHMASPSSQSESVRISSDGRYAAANGKVGPATVWDLRTETKVFELPKANPSELAFSPDGTSLVTSSAEGLSIWETGSWRLLQRTSEHSSLLRFSPDGRLLASLREPTVIWLHDGRTLEKLAVLEPPESYPTGDLAFSPDGAILAQITNRSGVVHLWDVRLLRERLQTMGLDWNHPSYPAGDAMGVGPLSVQFGR